MILTSFDTRQLNGKPKRSQLDSELGVSGKQKELKIVKLRREPTFADYEDMKNNDGTAWSLYQILKLPIMANTWRIEPDSEDEDGSQAKFVEDNFTLPPHRGGMSTPFRLVIARMLKATMQGRACFEKVWTLNDKGQIVYKKISPRDNATVEILRDENGGFAGLEQTTYYPKFKKVTIEPDKAFLFTINKEEDELEGQSMFRAAYFHYDRKHRLYYLYEQSAQTGAIPPKALEVQEGNEKTDAEQQSDLEAMDDFATGIAASALIPKGYKLNPVDVGKGRLDPLPGIEEHNAEMARSVLAQFILLGNQGESSTGSYALSKSHADIFVMALRGLMQSMEEHINSYLIPQLVQYNFANPKYPEFKFNDMTDDTRELAESVFVKIIEKLPEGIRSDFISGLMEQMASRLGIELDEENPDEDSDDDDEGGGGSTTNNSKGQKKKKQLNSSRWRRPLTPAEESIDLAAIEDKMNTLEDEFVSDIRPVYDKVTEQAIEDLKPIVESGDLDELDNFELGNRGEYRDVLRDTLISSYEYGKTKASDELDEKIPKTPKESVSYVRQVAESIVDKQFSDLTFTIKAAVQNEFHKQGELSRRDLAFDDLVNLLSEEFGNFFDNKVGLAGSVIVAEGISRARDDVFRSYRSVIENYQYSAILDSRVCPLCEANDGMVLSPEDYQLTRFQTPLHFLCRCIWIGNKKDQTNNPDETGEPEITDDLLKYQTFNSQQVERVLSMLDDYSNHILNHKH